MYLFPTKTGQIFKQQVGSVTPTEVALPVGVEVLETYVRPDSVLFQGLDRMVLCGAWNKNLIWMPSREEMWELGIVPSTTAPTLAAGAGTLTGVMIAKYTFAQIDSRGVILHESDPSPTSGSVSLVAQGRAWSGLPTTHPNPRVTHLRLYVSVDGADYQHVQDLALGSSSVTESVATNALGEFISDSRGVPPYAKYVTVYARRVWYSDGSDTFYYSEIDEPESVAATNSLKTRDGRNVTSIKGLTDQIVVATRKSVQALQGFSEEDFVVSMVTQLLGVIAHHAGVVVNDKLWFLSQEGYYRYFSGGFQFLMPKLRTYFRELYEADPTTYEDAQASVDEQNHLVRLLIPGDEDEARQPFYYVGSYLHTETALGGSGELPDWTFDTRDEGENRYDTAIGSLTVGNRYDLQFTGSCDGYIRKEGVGYRDDGANINTLIVPKHFFMGDQSGDDKHAHTFEYLDVFIKAENTTWTPAVYCGDDSAYEAANPRWSPASAVPASLRTNAVSGETAIAKTAHRFKLTMCGGKGATVEIASTLIGEGLEYRGLALEFTDEGTNPRPAAA